MAITTVTLKESRAGSRRSTFKTSVARSSLPTPSRTGLGTIPWGAPASASSNSSLRPAKHIGNLEHGDWFNAPWGVVWTTRDFGEFSNAILVGNFRSGWIAAFNGFTHKFIGWVRNPDDSLVTIDGLWSLTFGNDATAGPANTLFSPPVSTTNRTASSAPSRRQTA